MPQGRGVRGGRPGRWWGDLLIVAFFLAQAADGALTYLGVLTFGHGMEGNPLLAWMMRSVGVGTTLLLAKGAAAGFGAVLHLVAVHRVVAALTLLYLAAAILPWTRLLVSSAPF